MLSGVKFSVPIWPGLTPAEITERVIPTLTECRHLISDLYFTSRVRPFGSDAMGGIIVPEEVAIVHQNAMHIGRETGIPVSATFNNTIVNPSWENYQLFCKSYRPLYEAGVTNVTIPFTTWLHFGIKQEFPKLFVKNTILRKVSEPAEVAKLFADGFDYINLDRNLIRNTDRLTSIKAATTAMEEKLGKKLYLSLLYNEMCDNYCTVQEDHYNYNFLRTERDPAYFNSSMKPTASCIIKDHTSSEYILRTASIPSFYSQIAHYAQFINVFKMHGRESKSVFFNTLSIIKAFNERKLIDDPFTKLLGGLEKRKVDVFLKKLQNCKFDCWKCNMCSEIAKKCDAV